MIPQTTKYVPRPALYDCDAAPDAAAVMLFVASAAVEKLAANPIEGWMMIPYAVQKPPNDKRKRGGSVRSFYTRGEANGTRPTESTEYDARERVADNPFHDTGKI